MNDPEIELNLEIRESGADPERLDDLTRFLADDLIELGAEAVARLDAADTPEGAKGDTFTLGTLALVAVPALLPGLFALLQTWTHREVNRSIMIKTPSGLEVTFTPEKKLTEADVLSLVKELTAEAPGRIAIDDSAPDIRIRLTQFLSRHFNLEELRTVCFESNIEYDDIPGDGIAGKTRELVLYAERHGRLQALSDSARRLRPNVPWG